MIDIGEAFKLGGESVSGKTGYANIGEFISAVLPNIYVIAGFILFVLLIAGGFTIIGSGGNPEASNKGSKAITAAVIGFFIIICSYWLIQIIEHIFGINIFNPGV